MDWDSSSQNLTNFSQALDKWWDWFDSINRCQKWVQLFTIIASLIITVCLQFMWGMWCTNTRSFTCLWESCRTLPRLVWQYFYWTWSYLWKHRRAAVSNSTLQKSIGHNRNYFYCWKSRWVKEPQNNFQFVKLDQSTMYYCNVSVVRNFKLFIWIT